MFILYFKATSRYYTDMHNFDRLSPEGHDVTKTLQIPTLDGEMSVYALASRLYDSDHGSHMAHNQALRYSQRYGYDRETMEADFGADVNPIGHMRDLINHLQIVVMREYEEETLFAISDEEFSILAFACAIHDMGETEHPSLLQTGEIDRVVGDLPSGTKTAQDKADESKIRRYLYKDLYGDVNPDIIERVEAIISHEDDTLLHQIYEAAHGLQSLATGERAQTIVQSEGICCATDERSKGLLEMSRSVVANRTRWMGTNVLHFFATEQAVMAKKGTILWPACTTQSHATKNQTAVI